MERFVAFPDLAARVVAAVDAGLNVTVTGHPGAGQERIAAEIENALSENRRVVRVAPVRGWQQLAFSSLTFARESDPTKYDSARVPTPGLLRVASEELESAVGSTGTLLVTRPGWLDSVSSGIIAHASRVSGVPVVVVADTLTASSQATTLFGDLTPGIMFNIPALSFDEVHGFMRAKLGGQVEIEAVASIRTKTAGLLGLLDGVVDIALQTGALRLVDGIWRTTREPVGSEIGAFVEHMMSGLREAERSVLRAVAVSSLSGEDFVVDDSNGGTVSLLMHAGFVREHDGRLAVFPPALEEYARQDLVLRQRGQIELGGHAPDDRRQQPGEHLDPLPEQERDAALSQRLQSRNRQAARELRLQWETDYQAADALRLVVALQTSNAERAQIEDVVTRTRVDAASVEYALLWVWWSVYLGLTLGRLEDACEALGHARKVAPAYEQILTTAEQHLRMMAGGRVPSRDEVRDEPETDLGLGKAVLINACLFGGATKDAIELGDWSGDARTVFATQLAISGNAAYILDGRVAEGTTRARRALERAEANLNLGLMQAHAYVVMLGQFLSGELDGARAFLDRMLTVSTAKALHEPYQFGMIELGVYIEALRGDAFAARRLADSAIAMPSHFGPLPGMQPFASRAVLAPEEPAEQPWGAIDQRLDDGQLVSAAFLALFVIGDNADTAVVERLAGLTAACQSPLLQALGQCVLADATGDWATLIKSAESFRAMGAELLALIADARASAWLFTHGEKLAALERANDIWAQASILGPGRARLLSRLCEQIALSDREVEVVLAGIAGTSNKSIADSLHLSLRTVENHFHAVYRKSGLTERGELARACLTWLRPASRKAAERREAPLQ